MKKYKNFYNENPTLLKKINKENLDNLFSNWDEEKKGNLLYLQTCYFCMIIKI